MAQRMFVYGAKNVWRDTYLMRYVSFQTSYIGSELASHFAIFVPKTTALLGNEGAYPTIFLPIVFLLRLKPFMGKRIRHAVCSLAFGLSSLHQALIVYGCKIR